VATDTANVDSDLDQGAQEPKKPSQQILAEEIAEGVEALERPAVRLFLSALSGGLDIGFSLLLMAAMRTLLAAEVSDAAMVLVNANMYAVGFIFVVVGRSELFTEQTTLAVLPVLRGRATFAALLRLWLIVFVANILGAAIFAGLIAYAGPELGIMERSSFGEIARPLVMPSGPLIFMSAVLAGWLMGLVSWLVAASRDTISQIVLVWLITTAIGVARLHHVVAGSAEVLAGVFADQGVTFADFGHFLMWTTVGNAVGGVIFVALIKYNFAVRPKDSA
jgi:formate/nitrite transporter FocA (FNT family)